MTKRHRKQRRDSKASGVAAAKNNVSIGIMASASWRRVSASVMYLWQNNIRRIKRNVAA